MKIKFNDLIFCLAVPLFVGLSSALISSGSREAYQQLIKPPLSPPGFLFPIVWTILFILMGISSYLILTSDASADAISSAFNIFYLQLAVNFFWSIIFFNLERYLLAFFWLVFLWILILLTILVFYRIEKKAAYLLIPYILWVTFAGYLNLAIYLLNKP